MICSLIKTKNSLTLICCDLLFKLLAHASDSTQYFFNALQFSITLQFDIWYGPLLLNFMLFSASLVISMIFVCARFRFVVLIRSSYHSFHHWINSITQYLALLLIRKTLNLIPTSTGRSDVSKNRQRGNGEQCTFKFQYKFNMLFFIYKCYVRFHMYICSKSLYSQLQLSQSLNLFDQTNEIYPFIPYAVVTHH